jgi:hypothetical protein
MVLRERIELSTSPLPMVCSTTELPQHSGCDTMERRGWQDENGRDEQAGENPFAVHRSGLAAEPSWRGADDLRGAVGDLQHGQRTFVGAVRSEAEHAVLSGEA